MKNIVLLIMAFVICLSAKGQVETKIFTKGEKIENTSVLNFSRSSKTYRLPAFDATKMLAEDKKMEDCNVPFRFGKGFDVNLTLKDGTWKEAKGGKVWSLNFEAKVGKFAKRGKNRAFEPLFSFHFNISENEGRKVPLHPPHSNKNTFSPT